MRPDPALQQLADRPWRAVPLTDPIPVEELPTPALLLDEPAFERNLKRMATFSDARGKGLRPHAKTHKCPWIAHRQLTEGAVGICVAKLSEALVMAGAGIDRILITSPLVSTAKVALVAELAQSVGISLVVDSDTGLDVLCDVARESAPVGVLVDIDVAMGRTGTRDPDQALRLAERAATTPGLEFRGVQHYAGHLMHVEGHAARREKSLRAWAQVDAIVARLTDRGLAPDIVTGGGTGTYDIDCDVACITDLQVGSYLFMDQQYRVIGGRAGEWFDDFEVALTVATTAISQPLPGMVTVDGGYKAFAADAESPVALGLDGARFRFAGDEHGVLVLGSAQHVPPGSRQRFITPHCDPTVNLYDWYWVCNDGMATALWPIAARACSW